MYSCVAQEFKPDLALCDFILAGGAALADKLGIPKAILFIPGQQAPIGGHLYGSGASLTSTVPQWMTLLPRHMVGQVLAMLHQQPLPDLPCILTYTLTGRDYTL